MSNNGSTLFGIDVKADYADLKRMRDASVSIFADIQNQLQTFSNAQKAAITQTGKELAATSTIADKARVSYEQLAETLLNSAKRSLEVLKTDLSAFDAALADDGRNVKKYGVEVTALENQYSNLAASIKNAEQAVKSGKGITSALSDLRGELSVTTSKYTELNDAMNKADVEGQGRHYRSLSSAIGVSRYSMGYLVSSLTQVAGMGQEVTGIINAMTYSMTTMGLIFAGVSIGLQTLSTKMAEHNQVIDKQKVGLDAAKMSAKDYYNEIERLNNERWDFNKIFNPEEAKHSLDELYASIQMLSPRGGTRQAGMDLANSIIAQDQSKKMTEKDIDNYHKYYIEVQRLNAEKSKEIQLQLGATHNYVEAANALAALDGVTLDASEAGQKATAKYMGLALELGKVADQSYAASRAQAALQDTLEQTRIKRITDEQAAAQKVIDVNKQAAMQIEAINKQSAEQMQEAYKNAAEQVKESLKNTAAGVLQFSQVTQQDIEDTAQGTYQDKPDENARRLKGIIGDPRKDNPFIDKVPGLRKQMDEALKAMKPPTKDELQYLPKDLLQEVKGSFDNAVIPENFWNGLSDNLKGSIMAWKEHGTIKSVAQQALNGMMNFTDAGKQLWLDKEPQIIQAIKDFMAQAKGKQDLLNQILKDAAKEGLDTNDPAFIEAWSSVMGIPTDKQVQQIKDSANKQIEAIKQTQTAAQNDLRNLKRDNKLLAKNTGENEPTMGYVDSSVANEIMTKVADANAKAYYDELGAKLSESNDQTKNMMGKFGIVISKDLKGADFSIGATNIASGLTVELVDPKKTAGLAGAIAGGIAANLGDPQSSVSIANALKSSMDTDDGKKALNAAGNQMGNKLMVGTLEAIGENENNIMVKIAKALVPELGNYFQRKNSSSQ